MTLHDILPIISPMMVILGGVYTLLRMLWRRIDTALKEGQKVIMDKLLEVEQHVIATNGRVKALELEQARLKGVMLGKGLIEEKP